MPEALEREIADVARETLEKLAFVFAADDLPEAAAGADPALRVRVAFQGPRAGALEVALSEAALPELAANMLGVDDPTGLSPDEQTDALRELANVICGNLLPRLFGEEAEFAIATPVALRRAEERAAGTEAADCRLPLESGACRLRLFLEGEPPAGRGLAATQGGGA